MKKMFLLACLTALAPLLLTSCGGDSEEGSPAEAVVTPAKPAATALPEVGLFNFEENGKWGYWNWEKRIIIPPTYDRAEGFFEGMAAVMLDGKWGYIDWTGEMVIPPTFEWAMYFSEGMAPVKIGGKWGYINREGDVVIEPLYSLANDFTDGRAEVEMNGKRFYIDPAGNPVD